MKEDVQKFYKKKGYTYVIGQNALIADNKGITEKVIALFEKEKDNSEKNSPEGYLSVQFRITLPHLPDIITSNAFLNSV